MVEEITTQSWGSRIVSAFWGILIGFGLIIGAFILVFWNEGHGLHTAQSLQQTEKQVVQVPNSPIDSKNDQKVIYFTGDLMVSDEIKDTELGISSKAVKLIRQVEMYQWDETVETRTEKKMGGSEQEVKKYTYSQVWSDKIIDSQSFKEPTGHKNPSSKRVKSTVKYASQVKVGDFLLPESLITQISGETSVDLSHLDLVSLANKLKQPVQNQEVGLYVGKDPESPEIGDLKIKVLEILPQTVSIIAQQTQHSVQAYIPPAGQEVVLLSMGQKSPQAMIQDAQNANRLFTWILRLLSFLLMAIGLGLLMKPLTVIADVVPFIGDVLGMGTGLIACLGGLLLWTTATALAWFVVRPILAIGLIVATMGILYASYKLKRPKAPVA